MRRDCAARWISNGSRSECWDGFCVKCGASFRLGLHVRHWRYEMDELKYELQEETRKGARIKVIGIGGGGSNAVGRMYEEGLEGIEFYVMNTDAQALQASK